nr:acyltransferase [Pseudonocardia alni]
MTRVLLTGLVVAHHCAVTYSHIPAWTYHETPVDGSAGLLDAFVAVNQAWFMGAFFLISGWFVPESVDRHGAGGFIRGRLLRLGGPFLFFLIALKPLFYLPAWDPVMGDNPLVWALTVPDPGPLWFVLLLLVFSMAYAGIRATGVGKPVVSPGTSSPGLAGVVGFGLVLGLVSWAWWIAVPVGTYWISLPSAGYLPQYALCFAVGALGGRRGWMSHLRRRTGFVCAGLAVLTGLGWLTVVVLGGPAAAGGGTALSALSAALNGLFTATVIVAVLVATRLWLDRSGPSAQFLSANAYAVFVLHAPIVAWLGVGLSGLVAPALVKAMLLFTLAVPACWGAAWAIRRVPAVARIV